MLKLINDDPVPKVFMLFGRPAQQKKTLLDNPKHLCLMTAHPSPLSAYRGFFGSGVFKAANEFLKANGREEIDWQIKDL